MKNYAGHRLAPWLGHLMVSRSDTARALLTRGEIMQLPPDDEIIMLAGLHPVRAKKARYFMDPQLKARILTPPVCRKAPANHANSGGWEGHLVQPAAKPAPRKAVKRKKQAEDGAAQRQRTLDFADERASEKPPEHINEFVIEDDQNQQERGEQENLALRRRMEGVARQANMDPADGLMP